MNSCCPLALLLKNRGVLLTLLVVVPFGLLLGFAVRGGLSEGAAADRAAACPAARGGAAGTENSCESMHIRLQRGAAAPEAAAEPAIPPAFCPRAEPRPSASAID